MAQIMYGLHQPLKRSFWFACRANVVQGMEEANSKKFSLWSDLPIASASVKGMTTDQVSSAELGETEEIRRYEDFWFAHYLVFPLFLPTKVHTIFGTHLSPW